MSWDWRHILYQQLSVWRKTVQSVATHQTRGTQNPGFFSPGLSFKLRFLETLTFILKMPWQSSYSKTNHSLRLNNGLCKRLECQYKECTCHNRKWWVVHRSRVNSHGPLPKVKCRLGIIKKKQHLPSPRIERAYHVTKLSSLSPLSWRPLNSLSDDDISP